MTAVAILLSADTARPAVATTMFLLAFVINTPHFAHSYQIFYRNFLQKLFGQYYQIGTRIRYVNAGIVVPILLILFFLNSVTAGDAKTLAYGFNLMAFLVGWHYVKQGYGVLILDSVLKKRYFDAREKMVLRSNGYLGWLTAWLNANHVFAEHDYWGLSYYTFNIPELFLYVFAAATSVSTFVVLKIFFAKWRSDASRFPLNGVLGYLASIYLWILLGFTPLFILIVPAFHSLQYLIVVWRYQLNYATSRAEVSKENTPVVMGFRLPSTRLLGLINFGLLGLTLGFAGFWFVPWILDFLVEYDREVFGPSLFLFMFWIFINVHHYFLDNVMWRKENPDIRKYLFAHG